MLRLFACFMASQVGMTYRQQSFRTGKSLYWSKKKMQVFFRAGCFHCLFPKTEIYSTIVLLIKNPTTGSLGIPVAGSRCKGAPLCGRQQPARSIQGKRTLMPHTGLYQHRSIKPLQHLLFTAVPRKIRANPSLGTLQLSPPAPSPLHSFSFVPRFFYSKILMDLTGEQWAIIQPLIPQPSSSTSRGRPKDDQLAVLNGTLWKFRLNPS